MHNHRTKNKLVICLNPSVRVTPDAAELTGLDYEKLADQRCFDRDTVQMIDLFLRGLPGPVCLVAHNGDKFDYPIIMEEIYGTGVDLTCNVNSVDSINFFRKLAEDPTLGWGKPAKYSLSAIHEWLFNFCF